MKICIIGTGGTIEKTYDETTGSLRNVKSVLESILVRLRLPDLDFRHIELMKKDSLDLTDADRERIVGAVQENLDKTEAIIVTHGTDTLSITGELLYSRLGELGIPVILTGAMRPYEFRDTDAIQNLTEAMLACRLLSPGVYAVIHSKALAFPGVVKDREDLTFVKA